jgi:hypothetical protein
MDRYRARNNKNWFYFRELAATAKNFGKAACLLEEFKKNTHMERLLPEDTASIAMTDTGSCFFSEIICRTFRELQAEAKRLDLTIPKQKPLPKYGVKLPNKIFLPHTIEERTSSDRMHTVKKLTHRFAEFVEEAAGSLEELTKRSEDLAPAVPGKINEGTLRRLGTRLHNFQSWYDSYIAHSRIEDEMPELKKLRDIFSAELNLLNQ